MSLPMVTLPIQCSSCGKWRHNYSHCDCPDGRLWWIDERRQSLQRQLEKLDEEERDVLGLKNSG